MLNAATRARLQRVNLEGAMLLSVFDHLVELAKEAGSTESKMDFGYASASDDLKDGEFIAEISLVVRRYTKVNDV